MACCTIQRVMQGFGAIRAHVDGVRLESHPSARHQHPHGGGPNRRHVPDRSSNMSLACIQPRHSWRTPGPMTQLPTGTTLFTPGIPVYLTTPIYLEG